MLGPAPYFRFLSPGAACEPPGLVYLLLKFPGPPFTRLKSLPVQSTS